jgi:mRNA interferase RelE/StbE
MTYQITFSKEAINEFGKLDHYTQVIINAWISKHLENCENPRAFGKPLIAGHSGQWRYRIGDYRLLCLIKDCELIVLVIKVGHRRDVYTR